MDEIKRLMEEIRKATENLGIVIKTDEWSYLAPPKVDQEKSVRELELSEKLNLDIKIK